MGFFGSKKTYVSSQVWNLAGDVEKRPEFLRSTVLNSALSSSNNSIGEDIRNAYLGGPGLRLRHYYNWSKVHYDADMEMWSAGIGAAPNISPSVVATRITAEIAPPVGQTVLVQQVRVGLADFEVWAEQWVLANHPSDFNNDWSCVMSDAGVITVTLSDATTHDFTPVGFDKTQFYVYAGYIVQAAASGSTALPGALQLWIYRIGSGVVAIDSALSEIDTIGDFFSPIPVRTLKTFLSDDHLPGQYRLANKAYTKLTGKHLKDLVAKLADNDQLDDIDFAYVVAGVSLNVKELACRKYLYAFFHSAMLTSAYSQSDLDAWDTSLASTIPSVNAWNTWAAAQSNPADPLYGTAAPPHLSYTNGPGNVVNVHSNDPNLAYHIEVSWTAIKEEFGSGLGWAGAVKGDIHLASGAVGVAPGAVFAGSIIGNVLPDPAAPDVTLTKQIDATHWSRITIRGLVHRNFVYSQHYVETTGADALADTEESPFIVPLHYPTLQTMSLADTTQMATACLFLVLNSYKIVKTKWYQSGFFKVLVIVAAIAITIYTGQAEALEGALGLGGTGGLILAATILVASDLLLFKLMDIVLTMVFGAKIAAILEVAYALVSMNWEAFARDSTTAFHLMMQAKTLLSMTEAVMNGVTKYIGAITQDVVSKLDDVQSAYKTASGEIAELYAQNIGYGRSLLDPTALLDGGQAPLSLRPESMDTFLTRTLMTGSEIAELSFAFLHNFPELTLEPALPR